MPAGNQFVVLFVLLDAQQDTEKLMAMYAENVKSEGKLNLVAVIRQM